MREGTHKKLKRNTTGPLEADTHHRFVVPLDSFEHAIGSVGRATFDFFQQIPLQGALTSGAVGLYAATAFGVGELLVGGLTAYVAYRMFAFGEPLLEAVEKSIKFQKGELPKTDIERRKRLRPVP